MIWCAGGLITYHRTDGVAIANERRDAIRATIAASFSDFVPEVPRVYKSKVKNAQEAHDAITVTDSSIGPQAVEGSPSEIKLYELIQQTTIACQMTDAHFDTVRIHTPFFAFSRSYLRLLCLVTCCNHHF